MPRSIRDAIPRTNPVRASRTMHGESISSCQGPEMMPDLTSRRMAGGLLQCPLLTGRPKVDGERLQIATNSAHAGRHTRPEGCTNTKTLVAIHNNLDLKRASYNPIIANFTRIEKVVDMEKVHHVRKPKGRPVELPNTWPLQDAPRA